ncbi:TlpA disulfide reductase family protein [Pedobacter nyackensis]|uniref:Peroxiredoxin n=1 Tax=Pedobacter nyackensis TaxID=475255 RepID=A0A1W2AQ88_9SPHI|nr:TlpA disulfide reductase family protein [Pedobacter nyackensis]SMC62368.1 Peroxiredoxin [Pedobacter nyackensis]
MKNRGLIIVVVIITVFFAEPIYAQQSGLFQINGTFSNISNVEKVILEYSRAEGQIKDTLLVTNGQYAFSGKINEPQVITLKVEYFADKESKRRQERTAKDFAYVYIDPSEITISSENEFRNITVEGSKWQHDYVELMNGQKFWADSAKRALAVFRSYQSKGDTVNMHRTDGDYIGAFEQMNKRVMLPYIKAKPQSPLALYALKTYAGVDVKNYQEIEQLFQSLSPEIRQMPSAQKYAAYLRKISTAASGAMAPDFTLLDTVGKKVKLSSFKGKYVFLDFWASWCGPCMAEMPSVVRAYNGYKNKNFTVVGISSDTPDNSEKWMKAIRTNNLFWTQLIQDRGNVSKLYNVTSIPRNFLINPEGEIIANDLMGEKLEEKLKEIFRK